MIERFQYYFESNLAKRVYPDRSEAKALIEQASARHDYILQQKITEASAPFIFEGAYETIREAAQALMEMRGFKPYSHEAVISFIREFFFFSLHEISSFDRYRILRNKSVYGGIKIDIKTCEEALKFMKEFLPKLKTEFEKLSK